MDWRKHSTHAEESKKVGHGKGTGWGRLSNPPGGKGYVYYPGETLTSHDLQEEMVAALECGEEGIETALIVQVDDEQGGRLLTNGCGEALYIHSLGRIGIAWGADADWADAESLAEGIRMYHERCPECDRNLGPDAMTCPTCSGGD